MSWPRPRTWMPLVVLIVAVGLLLMARKVGLRFNRTASLPVGLYRLVDRPIERGDLVAACPPAVVVRFGVARGYLPVGRCPGGGSPVLKRVVALGGQKVMVRSDGVWVDDRWVQASAPRVDVQGRPLEPIVGGIYRLTPEQVWLATPSTRSFDSRYFGPIDRRMVLGVVLPVWTGESL